MLANGVADNAGFPRSAREFHSLFVASLTSVAQNIDELLSIDRLLSLTKEMIDLCEGGGRLIVFAELILHHPDTMHRYSSDQPFEGRACQPGVNPIQHLSTNAINE